jgi:glucosamine--fructose-6-phosphate aminotransferase (isomerizing)
MGMRDEILEQPGVIERLLTNQRAPMSKLAARLRRRAIDSVVIAARGTSDHAAIYAQYVMGTRHHLPVALATPSVLSLYGVAPRFRRALVVGISQSGASPDVVGIVEAGRKQGVPTLAITNDPGSALASAADHVVDLSAGPELAVAATKTYTAELVAVAMLSVAMGEGLRAGAGSMARLPAALIGALASEPEAERVASEQKAITHAVVLGRGYEYATAREWALKLQELTQVLAAPYSAADFQHGPIALTGPGFPAFAVVSGGAASADLLAVLRRMRTLGADLLVVSNRRELRDAGANALAVPGRIPEWLMPVVSIVPCQLHALHLARARGLDPDAPRHLRKVTLTH